MQLAKQLVAEGHTVHALYRSESKLQGLRGIQGIAPKKGDLLDIPSLEAAMEGCDAVYHVAAFAKPWHKKPQTFYHYNLDGATNVFEIAKKLGVKKVVFTSTAGTISPNKDGQPSDEATPRWVDYFTDYDRSKAQAEEMALKYCDAGLAVVTVNPSRVYGPGLLSDSNGVTKMVQLYLKGKFRLLPGNGRSVGNYVFIDDVVKGHVLAMQQGRAGERYILGGENASFLSFFETLSNITGKVNRMFKVPIGVMHVTATLMEQRAKLTGFPPVLTPPWVKRFNYNWMLSIEKARTELGYEPKSLEVGLTETKEWLMQQEN